MRSLPSCSRWPPVVACRDVRVGRHADGCDRDARLTHGVALTRGQASRQCCARALRAQYRHASFCLRETPRHPHDRQLSQLDSREEAVSPHTRSRSRLFGEGILLRLFELELSLFNKLFSLASMRHFWPSRRASTHDRRRPSKSRRQCTHTTDPRTVQSVPNVQRPPRPPDILRIYCRFSRYLEIYDSPSTVYSTTLISVFCEFAPTPHKIEDTPPSAPR